MYAVLLIDPARGYKQGSSVWRAAFTLVPGRPCILTKIANRCIAAILTVECRPCIASIGQFYITLYMFIICHGRLYFYWFIIVICCFIGQYEPSSAIKELPFAREFRFNLDADEVLLYFLLMN